MKKIKPEKAIRKYCLRCSCGDKHEVEMCNIISCPLYDYRLGEIQDNIIVDETTVGDLLDVKGATVILEQEEVKQSNNEPKELPAQLNEEITELPTPIQETPVKEKKQRKAKSKEPVIVENPETELNLIDVDDLFD